MPVMVLRQPGPLPIKTSVKWPTSDSVVVAVSGSAWTKAANRTLAVNLTVGSQQVGTLQLFANPTSTHLAFPSGFFESTQPLGDTPVTLTAGNADTVTDQNDIFTVTLIF
jgi:hypothetical protein